MSVCRGNNRTHITIEWLEEHAEQYRAQLRSTQAEARSHLKAFTQEWKLKKE